MIKSNFFEIKYPSFCVELTLKNDDILLFTLYYSQEHGFCLLAEDEPCEDFTNPEELISNISKDSLIRELVIYEKSVNALDANGHDKVLPITVKEVKIYDNNRTNGFTIAGNLVKYNQFIAEKYGLNPELAYDYIKPNIKSRCLK